MQNVEFHMIMYKYVYDANNNVNVPGMCMYMYIYVVTINKTSIPPRYVSFFLLWLLSSLLLFVVVLTLTHRHNTIQSVVAGQCYEA